MASDWYDINSPGFSYGKNDGEPEKQPETIEDEPVQSEPEPDEYRIDRAYFKEGSERLGFNKKCIVVVEGSFLRETIRTRIQGELYCESDAGVERLGCFAEGHAVKQTGTAELEVKLYEGDEYHKLTRQNPNAKCQFFLKDVRHSRGDRIIESERLEMPQSDVNGLGGIAIKLVDDEGSVISDRNAVVTMDGEELHNGTLSNGSFKVEDKPSSPFKVEIENEDNPIILEVPWQRAPLLEQVIVLPKLEEAANV
jgi:hypothetical protein